MQLTRLIARHVRIPLRKPVKHASHERTSTDNLILECHLDGGIIGYGEGVPRDYVTGETIDSAWTTLKTSPLAELASRQPQNLEQAISFIDQCRLISTTDDPRQIQTNAVRCALELAYLDSACRFFQKPLSHITQLRAPALYEPKKDVRYSIAITSATGWKLKFQALTRRWFGFRQCKVKVGIAGQKDAERLQIIRRLMGFQMELRVDANEAWPVAEVKQRWHELIPFNIAWVEQPVAHEGIGEFAKIRQAFNMPVMLDESLCGMQDAERCAAEGWGELFNLRLSKCGGFLNTLRLAAFAAERGLDCQLGCQVGETAILSAAGRHFACSVKGLRALEGSFDRYLVKEALSTCDITFGRGGLAPALPGLGLGITIDRRALDRVTLREETILG
jgi:L-alanine-DL-glutamate epimerase-like enolase superfamily enzyme